MTPKFTQPALDPPNPGPVPAPPSPTLERVPDSILQYPSPPSTSGPTLPSAFPSGQDVPGPSSTFIPRQPSPDLPDLHYRPFPPQPRQNHRQQQSNDSDAEEEDQVLASLPIYLSPCLFPSLHLLQYPLNHRSLTAPSWAKDRGKHISARVKEGVGRVEVEVPVDAGHDVWREDRADDLGFVTDLSAANGEGVEGGYGFSERSKGEGSGGRKGGKSGSSGGGKEKKKEKWGDKLRLRSEALPNATGYYSGIIHDGALHLHPISKAMQMRTSLQYLDDFDARQRKRPKDEEDGAEKKKPPPGPPIHRKLREEEENDGSGSIKDFRNKMWSTAQKEEEDKWVPYAWIEGEDTKVAEELEKMIVPEEKRGRLECKTRALDYLDRA